MPVRLLLIAAKTNATDCRLSSTFVAMGSPPSSQLTNCSINHVLDHFGCSINSTGSPSPRWRLADRFGVRYTLKHGSWLDMAEIELGILGRQCLSRRIDNIDDLRREANAWEVARDTAATKADWQFRTEDARIKLKKPYPAFDD